jgi:hypothetical protein
MKAITNTRLPGHAQNGRLFFATLSSVIGLFFAASYLIGCSGLTTSVRSSNTSNPDSLRVTTAGLSVGITQSGDAGNDSGEVLSRFGRIPAAVNASQASLVARTPAAAPSMPVSAAPLQIKTEALPDGAAQSDYGIRLVATGGMPPYSWDATAGQIAPGLTLRSSAGTISGVPFAPGAFSFTARVRDSRGSSSSITLSLNISDAPPAAINAVGPDAGAGNGGSLVMVSDESRISK